MDDLALNYQSDLNAILQMIADARRKAAYHVKDKIGCREIILFEAGLSGKV